MDIDAYRNFGIFSTKTKLERFEELSKQVGLGSEFFLECFISDLCDSFWYEEHGLDRSSWSENVEAARAFFEAYQVISRRVNGKTEDWAKL